jgi:hypothetical protein
VDVALAVGGVVAGVGEDFGLGVEDCREAKGQECEDDFRHVGIMPSGLGVVEGVLDSDVIAGGEWAEAFDALDGSHGGLVEGG